MHPVQNIRGSASGHLAGRTIVLAVCGSIGAVKCVELARELIRHGARVVPVMSEAATRILHPYAMEFATGEKPVLHLTGAVEHVALLGHVPGKADLLLVAPATANTVAKMALGIDDSPVTTCATVAFGTGTPVVVAPAMHEAMLTHKAVAAHRATLVDSFGVTWVEPRHEENKAKLADVDGIVAAVIHRLAHDPRRPGPLAGRKVLVVSGATMEPIDPIRILTNRSSGRTGHLLAAELARLGAAVTVWEGRTTEPLPAHAAHHHVHYETVAHLLALTAATEPGDFDQVWMPAAIGDFGMVPVPDKIPSEAATVVLELERLPKVIEALRQRLPDATLVAFKAESDASQLLARARSRRTRYKADFVVANLAASFGADVTDVQLVGPGKPQRFTGPKERVLAEVARAVAGQSARGAGGKPARQQPSGRSDGNEPPRKPRARPTKPPGRASGRPAKGTA